MYENGLTSGISATAYGSSDLCTGQMYITFILRALGYSEAAGDFEYNSAPVFAEEIGLTDEYNTTPGTFLRDNLVAISYSALFQAPKSGEYGTLLEKLVDEGAVSAASAEKYLSQYDDYNLYVDAVNAFNDEPSVDITTTSLQELGLTDGSESYKITDTTRLKTQKSGDLTKFSYTETTAYDVTMYGETMTMYDDLESEISIYYDGWVYIDAYGEKIKLRLDAFPDDAYDLSSYLDTGVGYDSFNMIEEITKTETDEGTTLTLKYSTVAVKNFLINYYMLDYSDLEGFNIGTYEVEVTLDSDGNFKSSRYILDCIITEPEEEGDESTYSEETYIKYEMTQQVNATGDDVELDPPTHREDYIDLTDDYLPYYSTDA